VGSASEIEIHRARREDLCTPCAQYLERLKAEGIRGSVAVAQGLTDVTFKIPTPAMWKLMELAEEREERLDTMLTTIVLAVLNPARGQARRIPSVLEGKIRMLHAQKWSTSKIAAELGLTRKSVADRLARWGLKSNGKEKGLRWQANRY